MAGAVLAGAISFAGVFYTLVARTFSTPTAAPHYVRAQRATDVGFGIFFLFMAWIVAV